MFKTPLKWILARTTEATVSVVLVLLFFLIFLALLTISFPQGTKLTNLIRGGDAEFGDRGRNELSLDMGNLGEGSVVATLSEKQRKVMHKPTDAIAWKDSEPGMPLRDRHAVQTFGQSGATISFDPENFIQLGQNSLVVIRGTGGEKDSRAKQRSLLILGGELRGRVSAQEEDSLRIDVVGADGVSRIRPQGSASGPTTFTAIVGPDASTTLSVHGGVADVSSGGRTIRVEANQAVTVTKDQEITGPVTLPDPPELSAPERRAIRKYRSLPPRVRFAWRGSGDADRYRFAIARDRAFEDVVYEEELHESEVVHGNLGEGDYFWRVRALKGVALGNASRIGRLRLEQDREPPTLDVGFPAGTVAAEEVVVKGFADPGSSVFIASQPVEVSASGKFEYTLKLERGANMVVVEAVDAAGNTTYRSQLIHAKY